MRGRLLTNGLLSLTSFIFWISIITIFILQLIYKRVNYIDTGKYHDGLIISHIYVPITLFIMWIIIIANLVMGIVTLAMPKNDSVRGLTIASGVLAILGGVFGVNAIVSFIAYDNSEPTTKSEQN